MTLKRRVIILSALIVGNKRDLPHFVTSRLTGLQNRNLNLTFDVTDNENVCGVLRNAEYVVAILE